MEVIVAEKIVKKHSTGHGIHDVSLSVTQGQCFGLLGANGSGKTTLTRMVAGLERIQEGRLSVFSHTQYPLPLTTRRRCGVALDTPAHWDDLSGRQNLLFFAHQYGLNGHVLKQRVHELLEEAGLSSQADDPVKAYSFGMRRKLAIIEAMIHQPDLLILDEPSAGLDVVFQERLAEWIIRRGDEGQTTWIADNDADWLAKTATDVVLLERGSVAASGNVTELMSSIDTRYCITIQLQEDVPIQTPALNGVIHFHQDRKQICCHIHDDPHLQPQLLEWITNAGGQVRSMEIRSITLYEALKLRTTQEETSV